MRVSKLRSVYEKLNLATSAEKYFIRLFDQTCPCFGFPRECEICSFRFSNDRTKSDESE